MVIAEVVDGMSLEDPEVTSFEAFLDRYHPSLLRFAYLLTVGDQATAEDAVQTVFVRLLEQNRWRTVRSPQTYLRRAVVNEWRTQQRHRQRIVPQDHVPELGAAEATTDVCSRDWVWGALACLSDRQRAAVVARYYLDLDDRETAHMLGCTRATVRSLIHRALPQVGRALAASDDATRDRQEHPRG